MKQKNLILMVVAVGCGLVAALLTSQMSAKPKVEMVDVIVAAKDLPVGTMITKEDLPKVTKFRKIPKDALPPLFVQTEEELVDKRLSRGIRTDEMFNPKDLNTGGTVTLPAGMDMMSVQVSLPDAVAGFVTPGSKVDLLATARARDKQIAFPLLVDMLVLAVDNHTQLPPESGTFAALNTVSFAVNREQALLLQLAKTRGVSISLVLRHPDKQKGDEEVWSPQDVIRLLQNPDYSTGDNINAGNPVNGNKGGEEKTPVVETPKAEVVMLPIATEDLPVGTELTVDVLKKFTYREVPAPAPANAVIDIEGQQGKVLQNGIVANQWLPKSFVGNFAPGKQVPKHEFTPDTKSGPETDVPSIAGPARRTHDVVVASGSGHKTFRYQEKTANSGEWALVGEVSKGGDLSQPIPAPLASPEPEQKVPTPSAIQD